MRIDPATLDPASTLARRIRAAIARERPRADTDLTADGKVATKAGNVRPAAKPLSDQICEPGSMLSTVVRGACGGPTLTIIAPRRTAAEFWRSEEDLHRAIVGVLAVEALPGVIAFHVPNGGKRGKAEAGRLKGMGTLAGIPDLIIIANGRVYGLEIKTDRGTLSASQKAIAERFRRAGAEFDVVRSLHAARLLLRRWGAIA